MTAPGTTSVVCGVDIGTTNTKVVAIDPEGAVVARGSRPTPRDPHDLSIDADALLDAVEDMLIELCGTRFGIAAVATAGVGEDGILVDDRLRALGRALAWFDPRRERIHRDLLPELEPLADLPVDTEASRTIFGWRWAVQQRGADRASAWVALADYPGARWAGRPFMSDSLAARTAAWAPAHRSWIGSRVDVALGDRRLLPEVLHSGEPVGPWRSARLAAAGVLLPDAVVVAGGHDHPIGGWGVDRMRPGAVLDSMGTAEVVVAQSRQPLLARTARVDVAPGIRQPGTTLLCVQELAHNMDWAARDPDVGRVLQEIVAGTTEPDGALTSGTFVPGTTSGERPRYASDAPRDPLSRASAVAGALAAMGEHGIAEVTTRVGPDARVFAGGGWSRASGWIRLKERVAGRSMTVIPEPEVTAVGAALLAAEAIGWAPSAELALGRSSSDAPR